MEYSYRTESISIGDETFDFSEGEACERMFAYCEVTFGFKGEEWDKIKEYFEFEAMGILIKQQGEEYSEVIGC